MSEVVTKREHANDNCEDETAAEYPMRQRRSQQKQLNNLKSSTPKNIAQNYKRNTREYANATVKQTNKSFMPGARCGEVFVTNNARKWTFICTFCNKSTRDIGDFICHIKMKHLDISDYDYYNASDTNIGDDDGIDHVDNNMDTEMEQDYLDCGNYLDVNVHTESHELNYSSSQQEQHSTSQNEIKKPSPVLNRKDKKVAIAKSINKAAYLKEETKATKVSDLTNGSSQSATGYDFDYTDEQYPHAADMLMEPQNDYSVDGDVDGEREGEGDEEDEDFDNQLLITPAADSLDNTSVVSEVKTKRRQIRGTAYCALCNKTFQYYSLYRNHMIKHTDETPYRCTLCKKGFKSKQAIRYHMNTHERVKRHKCELCEACYHNENQFVAHVLTHEDANTFPCMMCGKVLYSEKERDMHLNEHSEDRPFRCEICNKLFRLRHHLSNHLKMHRQYRCDYCKDDFTSAVHLRKPYACASCEQRPEVQAQMNADNAAAAATTANVNPLELFETVVPLQQSTADVDTAEIVSDDDDDDDDEDDEDGSDNDDNAGHELSRATARAGNFKKRFTCKYCQRSYSHLSGLNYHIRHKHY